MNTNANSSSEGISCFNDLPEVHEEADATFASELRPGHVLDGRFLIGGAISRSGMATVYQALDTSNHDQPVAVKIPHLRYEADPNYF